MSDEARKGVVVVIMWCLMMSAHTFEHRMGALSQTILSDESSVEKVFSESSPSSAKRGSKAVVIGPQSSSSHSAT